MDERKRAFDGTLLGGDIHLGFGAQQPKRLRPEEIVPRDDPTKAICRMLLNRAQFSRIIGKGGQTIGQIRNSYGVQIKGFDIDEDNRLVLITGSLDQVLSAFDVILDLLHQSTLSDMSSMMNNGLMMNRPDHMSITLLLEHSKAGKAVGSKGAMMQTIKIKSNASSIRIDKEPIDVNGVSLRRLVIEGTLASVRRAHLLVQELYAEPAALSVSANYNAFTAQSSSMPMSMSMPVSVSAGNDPSLSRAPFVSSMNFDPAGNGLSSSFVSVNGLPLVPVPLHNLMGYGVQAETVRQLTDMKAYLWKHFGLDLNISREDPIPQPPVLATARSDGYNMPKPPLPMMARTIESVIEARKSSNPQEVCFSIPRAAVGAVIGKGGQQLKDMQMDFGVRVFVEREDFGGKRLVVLTFVGGVGSEEGSGSAEVQDAAIRRCQIHISDIVEDFLSRQQPTSQQHQDQEAQSQSMQRSPVTDADAPATVNNSFFVES